MDALQVLSMIAKPRGTHEKKEAIMLHRVARQVPALAKICVACKNWSMIVECERVLRLNVRLYSRCKVFSYAWKRAPLIIQ